MSTFDVLEIVAELRHQNYSKEKLRHDFDPMLLAFNSTSTQPYLRLTDNPNVPSSKQCVKACGFGDTDQE
jgi:hypothetical protein